MLSLIWAVVISDSLPDILLFNVYMTENYKYIDVLLLYQFHNNKYKQGKYTPLEKRTYRTMTQNCFEIIQFTC